MRRHLYLRMGDPSAEDVPTSGVVNPAILWQTIASLAENGGVARAPAVTLSVRIGAQCNHGPLQANVTGGHVLIMTISSFSAR